MSIVRERRKYFKSEAKSLLRYNYPKQIFMTGTIILLTFGLNAIKTNIIKLLGLEYSFFSMPVNMFFDLTSLFITLPLYIGVIYVNIKLFEGENISVGGMFYYFSSSANLLECYKFITAIAARFIAFTLPFLFFGALFPLIKELFGLVFPADEIYADIAMICACAVYLAALFICVIIFMKYFAAVFVFVKNPCLNVSDIIKKSAGMMKKRRFEALRLILSFSLWILISHYLAGFLYIFFTLPYIMLAYASFLSFVLSEKGGEEFLTAAYDYVNERSSFNETIRKPIESTEIEIEREQIKVKKLIRGRIFDRLKKIVKVRKKQIEI